MRLRASFRTKLFLAFLGVSLLASAVLLHFAWRTARAAQLEALQTLLRTTVAAAAPEIDGDAHAALGPRLSPDILTDPGYLPLRRLAERLVRSNPKFKEVYTVDTVNGKGPGWGVLSLSQKDAEIGRPYDYGRFPGMVRGLVEQSVDDDIATDEYGPSLSGYAPIRDRSGHTVGFLGLDVDGSTVDAMRGRLLGLLAIGAVGCVVLAAALGMWFATRIHRPVRLLSAAMEKMAAGEHGTRVTWASGDEFEGLATGFNAMAAGLEERQRLKSALQVAMEIQQSLLPARPPRVEGIDLSGFSDYCDETGGDYYDYPPSWPVGAGLTALTVGDVTGHGIAAALMMSSARAAIRTQSDRAESPGALLELVNRHLARDATAGKFMTLFYGVLDRKAGTLRYSNAGQGGCFVVRGSTGAVEDLGAVGPPLGVIAGIPFPEASVSGLAAGDVIVLGTDGIWETADATGAMFGMERFQRLAREHAGKGADALAKAIRAATETFRGTGPQTDDVTLVVAKLDPSARAERP